MRERIRLPNGVIEVPDGHDPQLYLLGRITQAQEDLAATVELIRRDFKELRDVTAARVGALETGLALLATRFRSQVKTCEGRLAASQALRHPWYTALVGVIVAAAAGLLGALASLVLRGRP
jgi:hypothetical protein